MTPLFNLEDPFPILSNEDTNFENFDFIKDLIN